MDENAFYKYVNHGYVGRIWNEPENILDNSRDIWTLVDKFYKYTVMVKFETNLTIYHVTYESIWTLVYTCVTGHSTSNANFLGVL